LWTVALVLRQHVSSLNAEKILKDAETMVDRIRLVAEPIAKMGKSLDDVVDSYNKMVKSVESRLIPAARNMSRLGGVHRAKQVPELASVEESVSSLNEDKWGVGPENELAEGVSEIIDLEDLDEE
jgi:DNA recombination protein RmuC